MSWLCGGPPGFHPGALVYMKGMKGTSMFAPVCFARKLDEAADTPPHLEVPHGDGPPFASTTFTSKPVRILVQAEDGAPLWTCGHRVWQLVMQDSCPNFIIF